MPYGAPVVGPQRQHPQYPPHMNYPYMMEPVPQEYQQIQPSLQTTPVTTNHQTTSSFMAQETKQVVDNTEHDYKTTDDEKSQSQESEIFQVKINVLRYSSNI